MPELNDTNMFENLNLTQTYVREIIRAELGFNQVVKVELINKNLNIYLKNGQSFVIPTEEPFINEYSSALMSLVGNLNNNNIVNAYVNSEGLLTVTLDNGLKIVSDFSYLNESINNITGNLEDLNTEVKTSLVASINEIKNKTKDILDLYNKNVEAGAGANGWTADLVAYGEITQKQINDGLDSVAQLLNIENPRSGMRVYAKSYAPPNYVLAKPFDDGGGAFVYDSSKANINDKGMIINGWIRQTNQVFFEYFGAKADGVTNSTVAMQAAIEYLKSIGGGKVYAQAGTYLVSGLTVYSNIHIEGAGIEVTTIKLADNANKDLIYGDNANQLFGTTSTAGIQSFALTNICLDGNRDNNLTDGSGIAVFGNKILLEKVFIRNCRMDGVHIEWGYGDPAYGMEGYYNNIRIDTVGRHGFHADGPNDTVFNNVIVIDASQNEHATADCFYIGRKSHGRYVSIHGWSRSVATNRARYALNVMGSSNDFVTSHFEGAYTANVSISGNDNTISDSCQIYAAQNGVNVQLVGSAAGNVIKARIGAPVPNTPNSVGVMFGRNTGDEPNNNTIDCNMINQLAGCVTFPSSGGKNRVNVTGFMTSGNVIESAMLTTEHVKAEIVIGTTQVKFDTHSQSAWLGINANDYLTWTFPYKFFSTPCVNITPKIEGNTVMKAPIWIVGVNQNAVSIRNPNNVYVEVFIHAEAI